MKVFFMINICMTKGDHSINLATFIFFPSFSAMFVIFNYAEYESTFSWINIFLDLKILGWNLYHSKIRLVQEHAKKSS